MRGQPARPVREGGVEKRAGSNPGTALHADPTTMSASSTKTGRQRARLRIEDAAAGFGQLMGLLAGQNAPAPSGVARHQCPASGW